MFMEKFGLGDWQEVSAKYSGEPVDELLQPLVNDFTRRGMKL